MAAMNFTKSMVFRLALLAVTLVTVGFGYWLLLSDHAPVIFASNFEDMSYGWYVPVFSLYVLWRERRELVASLGAPSLGGFLLLFPAMVAGYLGVRGFQIRLEIVGFAMTILALGWIFFGVRTARRLAFPCCFLFFCIPLATFLDVVTIHLRLLAVTIAEHALLGFGADVVRQGTMLGARDGAFLIDVADPCSGLRSLFAMMALTAGYAYFTQPTWLRRAVLFCFSIPIAIIGNIVRILSIAFLAAFTSQDFALGFYHDYSGYAVFAVAILLMLATGSLMTRLLPQVAPPRSAVAAWPPVPFRPWRLALPPVAALLTAAAMMAQTQVSDPALAEAPAWTLGELPGFTSEVGGATAAEKNVLPPDTRIERRTYRDRWGSVYVVSLVVSGSSKSSIHRPELCLPGQGFQMLFPHNLKAGGQSWRVLRLERGVGPAIGFAYSFSNQDGYVTPSHTGRILRDIWDRSVNNKIDRWAMMTVNASTTDDRTLGAFLSLLKGVFRP